MEIFFNFPHPFSLSPCLLFKVLSDDKSYSDADLAMTPRINVLLLTCLIREEFQGESDHYFYIKMVFGLNTLPNGCLPVAPYLPPVSNGRAHHDSTVKITTTLVCTFETHLAQQKHSLTCFHSPTHSPTYLISSPTSTSSNSCRVYKFLMMIHSPFCRSDLLCCFFYFFCCAARVSWSSSHPPTNYIRINSLKCNHQEEARCDSGCLF